MSTEAMPDSGVTCSNSECLTTAVTLSGGGWGGGGGAGGGGYGLSPEESAKVESILRTLDLLIVCTYTPLIVLGVTGNSLSFCLMFAKARASSTYTYLCTMCAVDNCFLLTSILGWLIGFITGVDYRGVIDCNTVYILVRLPKLVSAWLLVAVSTERMLVVYLPTRAKRICDVRVARAVIAVIITAVCIAQWPVFGGYKTRRDVPQNEQYSGYDICSGRTEAIEWYIAHVNIWVRTTVYSYAPTILLFVINSAMAAKFVLVSKQNRVRSELMTSLANGGKVPQTTKGRTMAKYSRRMTIMAMALSITFLCLTLPDTIYFIWFRTHLDSLYRNILDFYRAWVVKWMLGIMVHANHAINFALYCLTSASFRNKMIGLITCRRLGNALVAPNTGTGNNSTAQLNTVTTDK